MRVYKLTDSKGQTFGRTQWGEGITHTASGKGELCGPGWIHAYTHPLLAVLLDPPHANYLSQANALLWEADAEGSIKSDCGLKLGVTSLTTRCRIPLPSVTTEQRVRFGLLCAMEVYGESSWLAWARAWLNGTDRSINTARSVAHAAARAAAYAAADAAVYGAADAAADAADAAAHTARAAADATVNAAGAATYTAHAAANAARAAANAARAAANAARAAHVAAYAAADAAAYAADAAAKTESVARAAFAAAHATYAAKAASGKLDLIALAEEAVSVVEEAN